MSLEGNLEDAHLLEIIRILHSGAREGRLTLQFQDKVGFVAFKAGEIMFAKVGAAQNEEALFQMTLWEQGTFRFDHEAITQPRSLEMSHPNLMIEASRRFSEWRMLSKKIPSLDMIPEFVPQSNQEAPQISLSTNEWVLLSKVDGQRSLKTIAEGSRFGVFETCKIFYGLISSGLLRLRAPTVSTGSPGASSTIRPATPRTAPAAPTFGFAQPTKPEPSRSAPPPKPAGPPPKSVDLDGVIAAFHRIGEKYLGSFASSIVDKSLKKARVDTKDTDLERQNAALLRAIDYTQKASSTILGPELARQMAKELEQRLKEATASN